MNDLHELADRLFAAISKGDLDAVKEAYAPDAVIWHNTDGVEQSLEQHVTQLQMSLAAITGLRFEDIRRHQTDEGFVQQHSLRGTTVTGSEVDLACCCVATVKDGRVTRMEEYIDPSPLMKAFGDG